MTNLPQALPNYLKILNKTQKPKFQLNKSLLPKKIKTAEKILQNCQLCERKCKVNRSKEELGWCQVPNKIKISSYFEHLGEEYFLVPSFTIFFWSCTFACQYCQNYTISQRLESGTIITEKELAQIIDTPSYCKNINFVGGSPTPYLPFILKTLKLVNSNLPLIWNSNFYMSEKTMNLLKNIIDIYLSDFKYGSNQCAQRLSKVNNYFPVVSRNHLLAFKDSELVIRHLILPNHIECCSKPILDFIKENFQDKAILNLMDQYTPQWQAQHYPEINRRITPQEFQEVTNYAKELNLNFIT